MFQPQAKTSDASRLDNFSDLIHRIYDAGMHPEHWTETVAAIAASMGASKGLLFTPQLAPQHGGLVFPSGIDEKTLQLWASRYIDEDVWLSAAKKKGLDRVGPTWSDTDALTDEDFVSSVFFREFLSKINIRRACVGMIFDHGPGQPLVAISVFRGMEGAPFTATDKAWLRRLVPHLSRSLGVMHRLDGMQTQIASSQAAFDRLPFGVVLMSQDMQVLHLNKAAQEVVERQDGLTLNSTGKLEAQASTRHTANLAQWHKKFIGTRLPGRAHFSDGFHVPRLPDKEGKVRQYLVQCAPVSATAEWVQDEKQVCFVAFITDPLAFKAPEVERLMAIYALTPAQARTAREFCTGGSYKAVASKLHLSEETVRSHIKEIYPKMRVNRQADLVRLLLSLAQVGV